jgi:hypothetical protein
LTAESNISQGPRSWLRRSWRFWFGLILSLASLTWLVVTTDWSETWQALIGANYGLVIAAVVVNILTIPMRSVRWRLMFPLPGRPAIGRLTAIMLIGQAINVFMPFRLGDLVRATLVESEHTAYVLGTQMLRLALDTLMLAVVVLILLLQVSLPQWWRGPGEALMIIAVLALLAVSALVIGRRHFLRLVNWLGTYWPTRRGRFLVEGAGEFLRSVDVIAKPVLILTLVAWTLLIWLLYTAVNYILLAAVGAPLSWLAALFLLAVLLLGIAVPSTPGRVGVYHYLAVQALAVFGVDQATAVSFAILQHLITVILPAAIGALLAWRSGLTLRGRLQRPAG